MLHFTFAYIVFAILVAIHSSLKRSFWNPLQSPIDQQEILASRKLLTKGTQVPNTSIAVEKQVLYIVFYWSGNTGEAQIRSEKTTGLQWHENGAIWILHENRVNKGEKKVTVGASYICNTFQISKPPLFWDTEEGRVGFGSSCLLFLGMNDIVRHFVLSVYGFLNFGQLRYIFVSEFKMKSPSLPEIK